MKTTRILSVLGWVALAGAAGGGVANAQTTAGAPAVQSAPRAAGEQAAAPAVSAAELESLRQSLAAAERRITELERSMRDQEAKLAKAPAAGGQQALATVEASGTKLSDVRAGAATADPAQPSSTILLAQGPRNGDGPVGEAPTPPEPAANVVAALPDNSGVLTRRGHFNIEPSVTYSRSSSNRLVFRGVEIVTGVQIGVIEANTAARDTVVATGTLRYGVTDRSELELRVPYIYRNDRITTVAQRDATITQTQRLEANDLGDVEFTGRYQLTSGGPDKPIIVANLRAKSDTGTSPYEIRRDEFGVAQELAVGSGFWGVEPSLSALLVSDPAVLFASLSYMHSFPKDINKVVGNVLVGRVKPGDSIGAGLGFGFSLNPRFSFSLGYKHNYIFKSSTELGTTLQRSESLQVGSLLFGMSYRITPARSLNTQFEFGVTSDAPSVGVSVRMPFSS